MEVQRGIHPRKRGGYTRRDHGWMMLFGDGQGDIADASCILRYVSGEVCLSGRQIARYELCEATQPTAMAPLAEAPQAPRKRQMTTFSSRTRVLPNLSTDLSTLPLYLRKTLKDDTYPFPGIIRCPAWPGCFDKNFVRFDCKVPHSSTFSPCQQRSLVSD